MNPVYTRQQLESCNRTQLWEICRERGLKCYPKTADCVEAIQNLQQSVEKVELAEVTAEPKIACATCPLFKPFNDGTGRGLCCGVADTSLVVREHHKQTQDCLNLIEEQEQLFVEVESSAPIPKFEKQIVHTFYKGVDAWRITTDAAYFEKLTELKEQYPIGELVGGVHDSEQRFVAYVLPSKHQNIADQEIANVEPVAGDGATAIVNTIKIGDKRFYKVCLDDFTHRIALGEDANWVWCAAIVTNVYSKTVDLEYKIPDREQIYIAKKVKISRLRKSVEESYWEPEIFDGFTDVAAPAIEKVVSPDQNPAVCSGSLTFKKVVSADPEKTVYEVFCGVDSLGIVVRDENGGWYNSNSDDRADGYATPYEAAAALLPRQLSVPVFPPKRAATSPNLPTTIVPEIEVDSNTDAGRSELYRVWYSYHLLGTFYQDVSGKWIAQPCDTEDRPRCNSAAEAQLIIVAMSGLLVADTGEDVVDLIDRPFDELTVANWATIKRQALQAEMLAAI